MNNPIELIKIRNSIDKWILRFAPDVLKFRIEKMSSINERKAKMVFGEKYDRYSKEIGEMFKKQQKIFPVKGIVSELFRLRPIFKAEDKDDDIENIIEGTIEDFGYLTPSDPRSAALNGVFVSLIYEVSKDGFNDGGAFALVAIKEQFLKSGNKDLERIGIGIEGSFNLTNPDTLNFLENYAADRVSQLNRVTKEKLRRVILQGYKDGKGPNGIYKLIRNEFDFMSKYRAKTIAFTELSIASGEARYQSYLRRGIKQKEWITRGPKPCPICVSNRSEGIIKMERSWTASGTLSDPAHPHCICVASPRLGGGFDVRDGYNWNGSN